MNVAAEIVNEFPVKINLGVSALFSDCDDFEIRYVAKYWETDELKQVQRGLRAVKSAITIGDPDIVFSKAFGNTLISRMSKGILPTFKNDMAHTFSGKTVVIYDLAINNVNNTNYVAVAIIHEFGHVLNYRGPNGGKWEADDEAFAEDFTTVIQKINNEGYNFVIPPISTERFDFIYINVLGSYK